MIRPPHRQQQLSSGWTGGVFLIALFSVSNAKIIAFTIINIPNFEILFKVKSVKAEVKLFQTNVVANYKIMMGLTR